MSMLTKPSLNQYAKRKSTSAFTLIELLVVIAIIALLASIMAPVFAQVRGQARSYLCASNLRQISVITAMYAQDYDETFATPSPVAFGWIPDLLSPYAKTSRIWVCLHDPKATVWDGKWRSKTFDTRTSYLWNAYLFQGDAGDWRRAITLSNLSYPSLTVSWGEGYANNGSLSDTMPISTPTADYAYLHNAYGDNVNALRKDPSAEACPYRALYHLDTAHNEGGNYAFADGHTKRLKPSAFKSSALTESENGIIDDRSDPFVTNGARTFGVNLTCPVFCCPGSYGTPTHDGTHPWFRP